MIGRKICNVKRFKKYQDKRRNNGGKRKGSGRKPRALFPRRCLTCQLFKDIDDFYQVWQNKRRYWIPNCKLCLKRKRCESRKD